MLDNNSKSDEYFMKLALKEAEKAYTAGEIPIGAIIVQDNKILSKGSNQVEMLNDTTAHAEMIALTSAFSYIGAKYLPDAVLYVTIEPCLMCAGALYWSKIGRIVYGAADEKNGYKKNCSCNGIVNEPFHPRTLLTTGIMKDECAELMKRFFRERRK